jgi:hypothetical protein
VRTIHAVGTTQKQPPCTQSATYAFSLVGPGSHACANMGRDHRSQNIFYVLDFSASCHYNGGTFCQKCHDRGSCSGFRSPWAPLPDGVWQRQRLLDCAAAYMQGRSAVAQQPAAP